MHTTYFHNRNGNLSSLRNTIWIGKNSMSITSYPGNNKGGVTFKNSNITTRFNDRGQCIGSGIKGGNYTTYFGENGSVVTNLVSFR